MADADRHLDVAALQELKQIMGDEFSTLIQTFENDSVIRIQAIREAVAGGDPDDIRRAAHSFKGSASNMGAIELANLCRTMEEVGHSGSNEGCEDLQQRIETEYEAVKSALMAL